MKFSLLSKFKQYVKLPNKGIIVEAKKDAASLLDTNQENEETNSISDGSYAASPSSVYEEHNAAHTPSPSPDYEEHEEHIDEAEEGRVYDSFLAALEDLQDAENIEEVDNAMWKIREMITDKASAIVMAAINFESRFNECGNNPLVADNHNYQHFRNTLALRRQDDALTNSNTADVTEFDPEPVLKFLGASGQAVLDSIDDPTKVHFTGAFGMNYHYAE